MYRFRAAGGAGHKVRLLGSGAILNEAIRAADVLAGKHGVAAEVWSVTSYKQLYRDALDAERWNMLHPSEEPRVPYVAQCLGSADGPVVAATDYVKALPESVSRWFGGPSISLGTDGFGRSDGREALRDFFEMDARHIVLAALTGLARERKMEPGDVRRAMKDLDVSPEKPNPVYS
jgi:pyruvate dehydrogenase E1 component